MYKNSIKWLQGTTHDCPAHDVSVTTLPPYFRRWSTERGWWLNASTTQTAVRIRTNRMIKIALTLVLAVNDTLRISWWSFPSGGFAYFFSFSLPGRNFTASLCEIAIIRVHFGKGSINKYMFTLRVWSSRGTLNCLESARVGSYCNSESFKQTEGSRYRRDGLMA